MSVLCVFTCSTSVQMSVLCGFLRCGPVGKKNPIQLFIPIILVFINYFHQGTLQSLFNQTIGLGMVGRGDVMLRVCHSKQTTVDFVYKLLTLVCYDNS